MRSINKAKAILWTRSGLSASDAGFTLIEMMAVITVFSIIAAMAVPLLKDSADAMQLGIQARHVERELQEARLRAVKANHPVRVRFNCPVNGQYRSVELIGTAAVPTAADSATNRCELASYPYPAPDNNLITRPNNDGPLQRLESYTTFTTSQTIEFWPDGTVHVASGTTFPWPPIAGDPGITLTLTRKGQTKNVRVNAFGKTQIQ